MDRDNTMKSNIPKQWIETFYFRKLGAQGLPNKTYADGTYIKDVTTSYSSLVACLAPCNPDQLQYRKI